MKQEIIEVLQILKQKYDGVNWGWEVEKNIVDKVPK